MDGNTILALCVAVVLGCITGAVWLGQRMNRRDRRESYALKAARAERETRARLRAAREGRLGAYTASGESQEARWGTNGGSHE